MVSYHVAFVRRDPFPVTCYILPVSWQLASQSAKSLYTLLSDCEGFSDQGLIGITVIKDCDKLDGGN